MTSAVGPARASSDRFATRLRPQLAVCDHAVVRVAYEIDAADRIIGHDSGWDAFARANDAPELTELDGSIVLWGSIADETTRLLWRALFDHVRDTGRSIDVKYRCDAPHARRWFVATLTPLPDRGMRFDASLAREELREPVVDETFDVDPDRFIRMCSWCARFACGDEWCEIEEAAAHQGWLEQRRQPSVTHTICPPCLEAQLAELDLNATDPPLG